jgi:hypothetical protein
MRTLAGIVALAAFAAVVAGLQGVYDTVAYSVDVRQALAIATWRLWAANVASAFVTTAALALTYVVAWRERQELVLFAFPALLFASMLPVYDAVRVGAPPDWFVCQNDVEAHAAPLAVVASLLLFGAIRLCVASRSRLLRFRTR